MVSDSVARMVKSFEKLARLDKIERDFFALAFRASALIAGGDVNGARALMARMESLHEEIKGMKEEGGDHAAE